MTTKICHINFVEYFQMFVWYVAFFFLISTPQNMHKCEIYIPKLYDTSHTI